MRAQWRVFDPLFDGGLDIAVHGSGWVRRAEETGHRRGRWSVGIWGLTWWKRDGEDVIWCHGVLVSYCENYWYVDYTSVLVCTW